MKKKNRKKNIYKATKINLLNKERLYKEVQDKRIVVGIDVAKTDMFATLMHEDEVIVDILVDKFFAITKDGEVMDVGDLYFDDYDEAIEGFEGFLKQL